MRRNCKFVGHALFLLLLLAYAGADARNAKTTANEVPISGTVKDRLGSPIRGVSVTVSGKPGRGSSSDASGHFTIPAEPKATLIFAMWATKSCRCRFPGHRILMPAYCQYA